MCITEAPPMTPALAEVLQRAQCAENEVRDRLPPPTHIEASVTIDVREAHLIFGELERLRARERDLHVHVGTLLDAVRDLRAAVGKDVDAQALEFHEAVGQTVGNFADPKPADPKTMRLRAKLVLEEAFELAMAIFRRAELIQVPMSGTSVVTLLSLWETTMEYVDRATVDVDFVALADACADVDYVVAGTRVVCGIAQRPIAAEVHRANMNKLRGLRCVDGKILKPKGWVAPDIAGILRVQGWNP